MNKILKIIKEIVEGLGEILGEALEGVLEEVSKHTSIRSKAIYNKLIQKFRFSLTFKLTLVYVGKTFSTLLFLGVCILGGFTLLSGWNAQEHIKRNFYLVSDYLSQEPRDLEEKIKRLAEIDKLLITVVNEKGKVLYSTEKNNGSGVFYGKKDLPGTWHINDNYLLIKDTAPTGYKLSDVLKKGNYSFGYVMILRESIQWKGAAAQIQIKNRMIKESGALILTGLILLVMYIFLLWDIVVSGAKWSKKILKPIEVMTQTVENITIKELNTRLNISGSQDELKDLGRTFNRMLDRIQESYERQNQFVSDASHELRTPIAVIQGYADLLVRWGKEDEQILDESLMAIKEESVNMKELVEKLLFLARSDKNTQKVQKKDFYLDELIEEIIKETKIIDDSHNIMNPKNERILIHADPRLIKESLRIFIDNCIKYTPSGGSIQVESMLKEGEAQISIEDTGVGIPKEDLPHIFNRFYRADKSRTKGGSGAGGTGLGLAIASWIIQMHNGRIKVESEIDVGTKVVITLPSGGGDYIG